MHRAFLAAILLFVAIPWTGQAAESVEVVARPDTNSSNPFYVGNRQPLAPSPLLKLPIGNITPQGWLRRQMELQADGMFGHLAEISTFLKYEGDGWVDPKSP